MILSETTPSQRFDFDARRYVGHHFFRSFAISANWARAAWRSSTISAAMISGSGRFALSSRLSSLSQKNVEVEFVAGSIDSEVF